ncbi:PPK2 family polyphosphate kinase [Deinococcus sp. SL84]|uniref:PPK2 family polyphosphate kinase n=1 Tax=Deinococcus sp. SL84 TaxID=2994663 RepID=UPI002275A23F|nr:PPK2 family polyphosphate kinase [Deinococcus sp. SL84]MCY1703168.1 polyphosphate kinase 2 family protein [Deinococcus sp. SL84]
MNSKASQQLQVPPGQKVRLADYSTDTFEGSAALDKEQVKQATEQLQQRLSELQEKLYAEGKQSLLIILQARDGGGKDSTVSRVMGAFNPNGVHVANFKAPTDLELQHDFLWRIHQQVPSHGMIAVFNRSHYEDVLVTRVHGLIDDARAQQNLEHIVNFEKLLSDAGTRIVKFYLHLSPEEQKARMEDRLNDPAKHWKFNPSDLKDRALWHEYTAAYEDALATSRSYAPWYIIPADRKWLRDYLISEILVQTLEEMNPQFPTAHFEAADYPIEDIPSK